MTVCLIHLSVSAADVAGSIVTDGTIAALIEAAAIIAKYAVAVAIVAKLIIAVCVQNTVFAAPVTGSIVTYRAVRAKVGLTAIIAEFAIIATLLAEHMVLDLGKLCILTAQLAGVGIARLAMVARIYSLTVGALNAFGEAILANEEPSALCQRRIGTAKITAALGAVLFLIEGEALGTHLILFHTLGAERLSAILIFCYFAHGAAIVAFSIEALLIVTALYGSITGMAIFFIFYSVEICFCFTKSALTL